MQNLRLSKHDKSSVSTQYHTIGKGSGLWVDKTQQSPICTNTTPVIALAKLFDCPVYTDSTVIQSANSANLSRHHLEAS